MLLGPDHKFVRQFGAIIGIKEFVRLYWNRKGGVKAKIPKAMDASFANPQSEDEKTDDRERPYYEHRLLEPRSVRLSL